MIGVACYRAAGQLDHDVKFLVSAYLYCPLIAGIASFEPCWAPQIRSRQACHFPDNFSVYLGPGVEGLYRRHALLHGGCLRSHPLHVVQKEAEHHALT